MILLSSCDTGITEPETRKTTASETQSLTTEDSEDLLIDALGKTGSSDKECRRKKDLIAAIQCMRALHPKGSSERALWTRALRGVRCNPSAMTASEAWDHSQNNTNKALWKRITRAIENCSTQNDIRFDVGFSEFVDPFNNGQALLGKTANDGDVRFIDGQTFSVKEGANFQDAMPVEIIIEVAASTNVTNFRVVLQGVDALEDIGAYFEPADGERRVPSGDTYPTCKNSNNCIEIVATELSQTTSLLRDTPPPTPVNRGRRTINFWGDTVDDNIVGPDGHHQAIIRILSVNGSGSIPVGGQITMIIEEDDISWVTVSYEERPGNKSRIKARANRQVLDEIYLRGDLEGPGWSGSGSFFWELPIPSNRYKEDLYTGDLTRYADCSNGRAVIKPFANPRLSGARTVDSDHIKIHTQSNPWVETDEIVVCN